MVEKEVTNPKGEIVEQKKTKTAGVSDPLGTWQNMDRLFDAFRHDMDRLMMDPFYMPAMSMRRFPMESMMRTPKVDIRDNGKEYVVTAEMPGISKDNLDIEIENDSVSIKARTQTNKEEKDERYLLQERSSYSFNRSFVLPAEVVPDKAKGDIKDGVLTITLPKKTPQETKKLKLTL